TRWSLVATALRPIALFYDPDRQQVEMIGIDMNVTLVQTSVTFQVFAWANGQWTQISSGEGPAQDQIFPVPVAYDAERHRLMFLETVMDETSVWIMDSTNSWSRLPSPPGAIGSGVAAFDAASAQVVIESFDSIEWTYDGSEWTSATMSFMGEVDLVFDPGRGHLLLLEADSHAMYERIGAEWKLVENGAVPCNSIASAPVYYEPGIAALELVTSDAREICR